MAEGAKVLDVGTGTGILAIAAALLGAADCLGIDIDSEAVRVASENTARNGVGDTVAIAPGDLMTGIDFDADIIVANLMADLVIRLSPAAATQLDDGGIYITSGILDIKEETVSEAIREAGFEILEVLSEGEWRAIVARRLK
jgi:ribosomal protein L11 methyltransferase